jgi:hypothetical protein
MSVIHEKIAHKKLAPEAIRKKERDMLSALNFELTGVNMFEFIVAAIEISGVKRNPAYTDKLLRYSLAIGKLALFNYELVTSVRQRVVAAGCIYLAMKLLDLGSSSQSLSRDMAGILKVLDATDNVVQDTATKLVVFGRTFEKTFSNLENLKKFNTELTVIFEEVRKDSLLKAL